MSDNQYFDLTTTGVGFINRFRLNKPTNGNPYYSITVAALRGKADDEGKVQKTYIDCNVVGPAVDMAKEIEPYFADDQSPNVMAKFVCGDLEMIQFVYSSGARKGQQGHAIKARVFDIKWFKVDGKTFYSEAERLRHEEAQNEQDEAGDNVPLDQHDQAAGSDAQSSEPVSDQASSETDKVELPAEVKLVKDDPYFEERKEQLKQQGYRWDNEAQLWRLPEAA